MNAPTRTSADAAEPSLGADETAHYRVVVLGAGMSGVCTGIRLRQHGIENFIILEKATAVGGTWRENTYPGVACDVPSHLYSFSFELNSEWAHAFSSGSDIWSYLEHCVDKYGLKSRLRFEKRVSRVAHDGRVWRVETDDGACITADVVVSGMGGLHQPNRPAIEGLERFEGVRFHTAEWRHDVDLSGKRVAIIGTGASGAQVLPNIAGEAAEVTVFQRHAAWVFPRMAQDISTTRRERYRRHPSLMRAHRWQLWWLLDVLGTLSLRRGSRMNQRVEKAALAFLERSVEDPETRRRLTPDYTVGCKRRVISDDYLATFNRNNVQLVTDSIARVEPQGVRDANGALHEVDVIIEATGFKPFDISEYVEIVGREGRSLQETWADGVETYRTVMVPGFPNLFLLLGPNSGTGHTSAIIMIESQTEYVMRCLELMEREGADRVEPTHEATRRFNARIQRDMGRMVFSGGCGAWYTDAEDRNFTLWPYSALRFIAELLRVRRSDMHTR